jgi:Signal transduction histidine kinase
MTMRIWVMTTFCLLSMFYSIAQQVLPLDETKYVDSLENVIRSKARTIDRTKAAFWLSDYWRGRDTTEARRYLNLAKDWGQGDEFMEAMYPFYEGQFYFNHDSSKAANCFKASVEKLSQFETREAKLLRATAWFDYGMMMKNEKGYEFFVENALEKAIPLLDEVGDLEKKAHFYSQIGVTFLYNAQYKKSLEYQEKALTLLKQDRFKNSSVLLFVHLFTASSYLYMGESIMGKAHLDQAKNMLDPYPESINLGVYYFIESLYFTVTEKFQAAIKSADQGIAIAQEHNQQMLEQMLVFRKYNAYLELKDYVKAKESLLSLMDRKPFFSDTNNRRTLFQQLSQVTSLMGHKEEAYDWLLKYNNINDSLNQSQFKEKLNALEIQFRTVENEKKIASLEAEKEMATLTSSNNKLYYLLLELSLFFSLLLALVLWFYYKKNKKLSEQREINYKQELKEMSQQQQLNSAKAILMGEENERKRVAQDLHDGLGGILAGIKMNLSKIEDNGDSTNLALEQVQNKIDYSLVELRRIARNMMPESLLKFGINTGLKDLCELYRTPETQIEYESFQIEEDIPQQNQLTIYRIVQELLSNAIKHSKASMVLVQCSQNQDRLFITVEDNGKGFDVDTNGLYSGMGLDNIRNRVSYLDGRIEINSVPGEGTIINIELDVYK